MKPAPFDYIRPSTVEEACAALAANPDARVLAGGQTLMPMLAMRLARPSAVVDVTRIAALKGIETDGGAVRIAAATTQAAALESAIVAREVPLLALALTHVGHPTRPWATARTRARSHHRARDRRRDQRAEVSCGS